MKKDTQKLQAQLNYLILRRTDLEIELAEIKVEELKIARQALS